MPRIDRQKMSSVQSTLVAGEPRPASTGHFGTPAALPGQEDR